MKNLLLAISISLIASCSSPKLEKPQVSDLLNETYPQKVIGKYKMMKSRKGYRDITIPSHWDIAKMQNIGLVQYFTQRLGRDVHFSLSFTKKGSELIHSQKEIRASGFYGKGKDLNLELICGTLSLKEIKNIFQEPESNEAEIEYIITFESTAFNDFAEPYVETFLKDLRYQNGQEILVKQQARKNSEGEWQLIPLKSYPKP